MAPAIWPTGTMIWFSERSMRTLSGTIGSVIARGIGVDKWMLAATMMSMSPLIHST